MKKNNLVLSIAALGVIGLSAFFFQKYTNVEVGLKEQGAMRGQLASISGADSGLIAWYKLDEAAGEVASDSSSLGNVGNLQNGPVWTTGPVGGALQFDGVNDVVKTGNTTLQLLDGSKEATISFWMKQSGGSFMISRWGANRQFMVYNMSSNALRVSWKIGGTGADGTTLDHVGSTINSISSGRWHHVAIVYKDPVSYIYVNGKLNSTKKGIGGGLNTGIKQPLQLGGYTGGTYYRGALDDIRVYNRAIGEAEVNELFALGNTSVISETSTPNPTSSNVPTVTPTISPTSIAEPVTTPITDKSSISPSPEPLVFTPLKISSIEPIDKAVTSILSLSQPSLPQEEPVESVSGCEAAAGKNCWYIDPKAINGLKNGTSWENAWTSLHSVNSTNVKPGDFVYISGGDVEQVYYLTKYWRLVGGSDMNNMVTYKVGQEPGHNGMVRIDGRQIWAQGLSALGLQNDSVISIPSYTVLSGNYRGERRMTIDHFLSPVIQFSTSNKTGFKMEYVNYSGAMRFEGASKIELSHNRFRLTRGSAGGSGNQQLLYMDFGLPHEFGVNSIHHNIIDTYGDFFLTPNRHGGGGADLFKWPVAVDIYNNNVYHQFEPYSSGIDHEDLVQGGGKYSRIFNNYFEGATSAILFLNSPGSSLRNLYVFNNILTFNDERMKNGISKMLDGISGRNADTSAVENVKFMNNTIVDAAKSAGINLYSYHQTASPGVVVANNISFNAGAQGFANFGFHNFSLGRPEARNNLVDAGSHGNANINGITSIDTKTWNGSAQFESYKPHYVGNDFHLSSSDTVARGGGMNLSNLCAEVGPWLCYDKDGVERPVTGAWDIGAYQYNPNRLSDTSAPSRPSNVHASFAHWSAVTLNWTDSTDNKGVTGYRILRDGTLLDIVGITEFTDPVRDPSTTYEYSVQAVDEAGNISSSANLRVTTPPGKSSLRVGDTVKIISDRLISTEASLRVKSSPESTTSLGEQLYGANTGVIIGGPQFYKGYTYWNIDWSTGVDGWTIEGLAEAMNLMRVNAPDQYKVTVKVVGNGVVKNSSQTLDCGTDCEAEISPKGLMTLIALPAEGYTLYNWNGDGCSGTWGMCSIQVHGDYEITATFAPIGSTPPPPPPVTDPTVTVQSASNIALTSATLNGSITSIGASAITAKGFEWGTTSGYGTNLPVSGSLTTGSYSGNLTGLTCGTTYYYRSYATNSSGTGRSGGSSFTTAACVNTGIVPEISTFSVTGATTVTATLNGNVDSLGNSNLVAYGFAYGTSPTLTNVISTTTLGVKSSTGTFSQNISGLNPNTTYYVRAYGRNSGGTGFGSIRSFVTPNVSVNAPSLSTEGVSSVTGEGAVLSGSITSTGGADAVIRGFEWGLTSSYGTVDSSFGTYGTGSFSTELDGLSCSTTYHYRSFATNSAGDGFGPDRTFRTSDCATSNNDLLMHIDFSNNWESAAASSDRYGNKIKIIPDMSGTGNDATCQTQYYLNNNSQSTLIIANQCPIKVAGPGNRSAAEFTGSTCKIDAKYLVLKPTFTNLEKGSVSLWVNYDPGTDPSFDIQATSFTVQHVITTMDWLFGKDGLKYTVLRAKTDGSNTKKTLLQFPDAEGNAASSKVTTESWNLYTFTWDGTNVKGYYNGKLFNTVSQAGITSLDVEGFMLIGAIKHDMVPWVNTTTNNCTGYYPDAIASHGYPDTQKYVMPNAAYLEGKISDLRIYGRAITEDEVAALYGNTTPPPPPPTVTKPSVSTVAASSITAVSATMNGNIVSLGNANLDTYGFAYSTNANLSTSVSTTSLGSKSSTGTFVEPISNLSPNTTYYFRAYGRNSAGTGFGAIRTFVTSGIPTGSVPTVVTFAASEIGSHSAIFNATLDDKGSSEVLNHGFAYSTSANLTSGVATTTLGVKSTTGTFSQMISSLSPNTTYYVRPYARNSTGTGYGMIRTFTTSNIVSSIPSISLENPTVIQKTTAKLNASIDATGGENIIRRGFEWGLTTAYGQSDSTIGTFGTGKYSINVSNLQCNTTYNYRAFAINPIGTALSPNRTFKTDDCVTTPPPREIKPPKIQGLKLDFKFSF